MRVIIRADGNREIAMGHMMRCLSIADALRKAGAEVAFVTAGPETKALLAGRGYAHTVLETSYKEMETELPVFQRYVREFFHIQAPFSNTDRTFAGSSAWKERETWILVDSYFVTGHYMEELGRWAKTAYIDDMGQPVWPVDLLIDYNIYGDRLPYRQWYSESEISLPQKCLLGCRYAPLRAEFQGGRRSRVCDTVTDVLVTTGGGDQVNAAGKLCRRLAREKAQGRHRGIRYHIVCGPFSQQKKMLRALSGEEPEFIVHENVTEMAALMEKCDIAVSAAGSTMYELCSMRLPAVCFYFAENQRQMAECFDRLTEIRNAGNMALEEEKTLDNLLAALDRLEQDRDLRGRIREQMGRLTDGRGAERIAAALMADPERKAVYEPQRNEKDEEAGSEF